MKEALLEIACFDAVHVKQITAAGANRIELCSNVSEGGVTPSYGMIAHVRANTQLPLYVMLRPRGGNFIYSDEEVEIMMQDIAVCKKLNVDGLVFGLLDGAGNIDLPNTAKLIEISKPLDITFHRAFDACSDPFKSLDDLISLGIKRILTSGQKSTALEGINLLHDLLKFADDRIEILAGGGVTPENAKALYNAGIRNFHASAYKSENDKIVCDENKIKSIIKILQQ